MGAGGRNVCEESCDPADPERDPADGGGACVDGPGLACDERYGEEEEEVGPRAADLEGGDDGDLQERGEEKQEGQSEPVHGTKARVVVRRTTVLS